MTRSWVASALIVTAIAAVLLWVLVIQGGEAPPADTQSGEPTANAAPSGEEADEAQPARPSGTDTRDWDDIDACNDGLLPAELEPVTEDIEAGGPYDYPDRDATTFENREGFLPDESWGYYQEFTVETPGLSHRGAKRVVTGGGEVDPEVWYYTDDHYESFCEFAP